MSDTGIDDVQPLEPKLEAHDLLENEDSILEALLDAGEADASPSSDDTKVVRAKLKGGKVIYSRVRAMDEDDEEWCRKRAQAATKQEKRGRMMLPMRDMSTTLYRSFFVLRATVAFCLPIETDDGLAFKDVEPMWNNKELRTKLNVNAAVEVIDKVMPAGQKTAVIGVIEELSGYGDESIETDLKN